MASIQRRGKNSFLLVVELGYDGRGKRIRRTKTIRVKDEKLLRTKKRLEDHLNKELYKFKVEIESGEYIQTDNLRYSQFVKDWTEKHSKRELAIRTQLNYQEKLDNYILLRFGNHLLHEMKTMEIVNFLNDISKPGAAHSGRKKPLSGATLYEIDKTMRVIFNKAVEWQIIKESPMKDLSRPTIKKKKMSHLDSFGIAHFLESMYKEQSVWRMLFITSAISGYRRGEILALQWNNINFEESYFKITKSIPLFEKGSPVLKGTKTDEEERITYMPDWYMEELSHFKEFWNMDKNKKEIRH